MRAAVERCTNVNGQSDIARTLVSILPTFPYLRSHLVQLVDSLSAHPTCL